MHSVNKKKRKKLHPDTAALIDVIHLWSSEYPSARWVETQTSDCWTAEPTIQQQMTGGEEMETDAR